MSLNLRPILSALLRNRTGAVLVALQIALALAILVNATYIVKQRVDSINRPTGIDDANLFVIESSGFTSRYDYATSVRDDLAYLRGLNGVIAATPTNAVPLSGSGSASTLYKAPGHKFSDASDAFIYEMDEQGLQTLGAHLIAGRNFRKEEIMPPTTADNQLRPVPQIVVTQELAQALFTDGNALGKVTYDPLGRPITIIGVINNIVGPWTFGNYGGRAFFAPEQPLLYGFQYLVRTQPGRRDEIMRIAEEHLSQSDPNRVIKSVHSLDLYEKATFLSQRITAISLVIVTALLLAIAALGIFGLATFNVSTRTKQIGTRRAIGARKRDIIRHFLVENGLITTTGIVVGCALALGLGYELSRQYNLPRLDLYYLVGGVLVLWVLGQLAARQPAGRAAAISPSVATRTV
jgi:putative ABC transport system permease protein